MEPIIVLLCISLAFWAVGAALLKRRAGRESGSSKPTGPSSDWMASVTSWAAVSVILIAVASTMKGAMLLFADPSVGASVGFFASAVVLFLILRLLGPYPK
ncbi:MAG: hypothetical protein SFW09_17945 [Hyphomicrobiaceae bacterium]|nr:hypothetical protein [Hyphomicrobiaceae bacterium]